MEINGHVNPNWHYNPIFLYNKTYELRMPTVEEWQFILDNGYLGQINNKSFGSGYSFAATSTYVKPGEEDYREDLEYIYTAAYSGAV